MNNNFKQGFKKFAVVSASALFALSLGGGTVNAMHTNVHAMTADQMFNDRYANHGIPQATIQREHKIVNNCLENAETHPSGAWSDLDMVHNQIDINSDSIANKIRNIAQKYDAHHADITNANDTNNPKSWAKYGGNTQPSGNNISHKSNVKKPSNRKPAKKAPARKNHAKRISNNSGLKIIKNSHRKNKHSRKIQNQDKKIKSLKRTMRKIARRISTITKRKHRSYRAKRNLNKLDKTYSNIKSRLQRMIHKSSHKAGKRRTVKYHSRQHNRRAILQFK